MSHELLDRLQKVKQTGQGKYMACCPAHDDRTPSLAVGLLDDGRVLIHCFAGCAPSDVLEAVGMSLSGLFPDGGSQHFGPLWWAQKERKEREKKVESLDHERLILSIAKATRAAGKRQSKKDLEREKLAWLRVNGRA